MEVTLTINKQNIMTEVARSAQYTGSKMEGSDSAFDRIRTVDDDAVELNRFYDETCAESTKYFVGLINTSWNANGELKLNLSEAFDTTLQGSMSQGLEAYFVQNILAKWYVYTNKEEAKDYQRRADALIEEVRQKAYVKKKPARPNYSNNNTTSNTQS